MRMQHFWTKLQVKITEKGQESCIITHYDVDIFQVQFLGTFSTFGSQIENLRKPENFDNMYHGGLF